MYFDLTWLTRELSCYFNILKGSRTVQSTTCILILSLNRKTFVFIFPEHLLNSSKLSPEILNHRWYTFLRYQITCFLPRDQIIINLLLFKPYTVRLVVLNGFDTGSTTIEKRPSLWRNGQKGQPIIWVYFKSLDGRVNLKDPDTPT